MDTEIYNLVCIIVEFITSIGATLYIYHRRFRWKFPISAAIIIIPLVIDQLGEGYITLSGWPALLYYLLEILIGFLIFKPGLIMRSWILISIYNLIYNVGGMGLYLLVIIPYRWLTGSPSTAWFAGPGVTLDELIIFNLLKIVTAALFSWITVKLADKIDAMKNDIIIPIFIITFIPRTLAGILNMFIYTDDAYPLSGPKVVIYGLEMVIILVSLIGLALAIMRRTYVENRLLALAIAEDVAYYQRIQRVQQELRELRHDMHNYLQADREKVLTRIPEYIENIKHELKEMDGNE